MAGRGVADARAAVAADIHERVDPALRIPHDNDGLACDLEQEIVPALRYLAGVPDVQPGLQHDVPDLQLVDLRVAIDGTRERVALPVSVKQLLQ